MSAIKTFKKGEFLFKEGEKATNLYLIQSGSVSVCIARQKKNVEIFHVGNNHVVGEHALHGLHQHNVSALALTETKAIEIPVEPFRGQIEASPQLIKALIKGLGEKVKLATNDLRTFRMEKEGSPCPEDQTAKIFGAVFHTANHKGKKEGDKVTVEWTDFKKYAQRVFLESPKRLEQAVCVLVKLKIAEFQMVKNEEEPDGPDVIGFVHFRNLRAVEDFFEFYQYYYFKGGKMDLLKSDEFCIHLVNNILKIAAEAPLDRHGSVRLDYPQTVERYKNEHGLVLNSDHFARLETKGLFVKRVANDTSVSLQFELAEFKRTLMNWRVLREIEKWNEQGFIDMNEDLFAPKAKAKGPVCPSCAAEIKEAQKFCAECGHKLAA